MRLATRIGHRRSSKRAGIAAMEMALIAPIMCALLFGIIEFGLMAHVQMQLNNIAREGARVAIVGATPDEIMARMEARGGIDISDAVVTVEYRAYLENGTWSEWMTVGSDGTTNTASSHDGVRIRMEYEHRLIVLGMFGLADDAESNTKTLVSQVTMRRE